MDFEMTYGKLSGIDIDNKGIMNEIEGKRKSASPFRIGCLERNGKWGVWLKYGDGYLLLPPKGLFESIFRDYSRLPVHGYLDGASDKWAQFNLYVTREPYIYSWSVSSPFVKEFARQHYMQDEYIDTVRCVLQELKERMEEGADTAYDSQDVRPDALGLCIKQFEIKSVFPSYHTLKAADVQEEEFVFEPLDTERYTVGIGERQYTTYLTHWDSDYEYIRHQLEEYAYSRKATLTLPFDTSGTVLRIEKRRVLDHTEEDGDGVRFKYRDFMRVEIRSDEFSDMPVLRGYCDTDRTLRTLYEGLLRLALLHRPEGDYDEPSQMAAYNRFKSPVIERVLNPAADGEEPPYSIRQIHIKDVLTIDPDFDVFIRTSDGLAMGYDSLEDLCGRPVHIEGLQEWCQEMAPIIMDASVGKEYHKDWEDFHRRGIALVRELRKVLPEEYDLWYTAPFEDSSGVLGKPVLII